jgi:hypothetical protein
MVRKDLYIGLSLFALILFGNSYISAMRDGAKQEQFKADVKSQVEAIGKTLDEKISAIRKDEQTVKTPAQIAVTVPKYQEGVHPILVIPGGVPTSEAHLPDGVPTVSLPDAPSAIQSGSLVIPRDEVPAYWKSVTACAENSANLIACQGELPLQVKRAESAEKAMRGGSFWSRTRTKLIWLGVGAGVGYVAAKR